jgi:PAT family beta-lactamase induction signal transducer AmpG
MSAPETPRRDWLASLNVYANRRQAAILLMGFSSGLPLLLTLSTLSYWLAKLGVDKTTIGLFAATGLPYTLKFVWAPLFDHLKVPGLARLLGRRRSWILVTQFLLAGAILFMGTTDPSLDPWPTALAAMLVAFLSASQDIVVDAYRIDVLEPDEQGAGAAMTQTGYRIGILVAGAGAIALADFVSWPVVFAGLAACMGIGMFAVLFAPEPPEPARPPHRREAGLWDEIGAVLRRTAVMPFLDFFERFRYRETWALILLFALLYKYGDAIGGVMANPFYVEMGFSGVEIASVSKVFGLIATLAGTFAGGFWVARYGLFPALLFGGIFQAVTNLTFALLAWWGKDVGLLALAIGVDNFAGGFGAAAFVAYFSSLCSPAFTATQYALLTSLMSFGRTGLSTFGGWLADHVDWVTFFVLTTLFAVPGLLLLLALTRRQRGHVAEAGP